MDSFHSETISSDSTSESCSAPQNPKKVHTKKIRRSEDLISLNISKSLEEIDKKTDFVEDVGGNPVTKTNSSTSQSSHAPRSQKKTRKARRTEDLISLNISNSLQEDTKQTDKKVRQNNSFLPKIDLVEDVAQQPATKTNTFKQNRSSLAKKAARLKIGRSMIEGKQFKSKSKFKIKWNFSNSKNKEKSKMGQAVSGRKDSNQLLQVLSDAAEEFHTESATKLKATMKRKSKSLSFASRQDNNNEGSRVVLKDLYVNLVPLEKTNLLNEDQIIQLKIKQDMLLNTANFNNHSSKSRRKSYVGKENSNKTETPKASKIPTKLLSTSIGRTENLQYNNNVNQSFLSPAKVIPCKVILERINPERMQLLTSPKGNNISLEAALPEGNTILKAEANSGNVEASELSNQNISINALTPMVMSLSRSNISDANKLILKEVSGNGGNFRKHSSKSLTKSLGKTRKSSGLLKFKRSNNLIANCEESFFNPEGTSSPLVLLEKIDVVLNKSNNTLPGSPPTAKRLTYELEADETKFIHSENVMVSDAKLKNDNLTSEIEAGSSARRSSKIRKNFEDSPDMSVFSPEAKRDLSTTANKSKRKSSTSSNKVKISSPTAEDENHNKNGTYELDKTTGNVSKQKSTDKFENDSDEGAVLQIRSSNHSKISKNIQLARHSVSHESAVTKSRPLLFESFKRRRSCNLEANARKKKRSNSCDTVIVDLSVHYQPRNEIQSTSNAEKPQKLSTPKKRRSTLTLEDSVNDVALLKSMCDSSDTPQKLNKSGKKSQTLIKQALGNKSATSSLDYCNVTLRKHESLCSENVEEPSEKKKKKSGGRSTSILDIERTSPPWSDESDVSEGTYEINKTDDLMVLPSSSREPSKTWIIANDMEESDTEEEKEPIEETETPSSDENLELHDSFSTQNRRTVEDDVIEVSDEVSSLTATSSDDSDSDNAEDSPNQVRRVTFRADVAEKEKPDLPKVSFVKINTPKSAIKTKTNRVSAMKDRRVTFSDMSVIIVDDDSSQSLDSPERRRSGASVPTNFPSDDDDSPDELPEFNKRGTIGRTPIQKRVVSAKFDKGSPARRTPVPMLGCFQSPRSTPVQLQNRVDSPQFNKKDTIGRTPMHSKMRLENNNESCVSPKLNRISSGERLNLQNEPTPSTSKKNNSSLTSKRTKMPNFASIHKKMYDKMLNLEQYSKRKDERAKLLLSGHKPEQISSSLKKSPNKHRDNFVKKISSKKQLKYEEPSTSTALPNERVVPKKKPVLVSSTPKGKKNEKNGYTRYGFKKSNNQFVTTKEQMIAVANKMRPLKSTTADKRTEIKGVRSNRRFDLLMNMRQKQQK